MDDVNLWSTPSPCQLLSTFARPPLPLEEWGHLWMLPNLKILQKILRKCLRPLNLYKQLLNFFLSRLDTHTKSLLLSQHTANLEQHPSRDSQPPHSQCLTEFPIQVLSCWLICPPFFTYKWYHLRHSRISHNIDQCFQSSDNYMKSDNLNLFK